jgi:hypothetical protein
MDDLTRSEGVGLLVTFIGFIGLTALGVVLFRTMDPLPVWLGAPVAIGAITALIGFVGVIVRAARRQDHEGVEREVAARASMITVLVVVLAGLGYSLLEAFAGAPRVTAAAASALACLVWIISWTWMTRRFE